MSSGYAPGIERQAAAEQQAANADVALATTSSGTVVLLNLFHDSPPSGSWANAGEPILRRGEECQPSGLAHDVSIVPESAG